MFNENVREFSRKISNHVNNFNLFPSVPPTTDPHQLKTQLISTRVFIILLTFAIIILFFYTSMVTIGKTFIVTKPSLHEYEQLYEKYSQTLTCTCTQISIQYGKFLHHNYVFHQICTSDFVGDQWIDYLDTARNEYDFLFVDDFRARSRYVFRTLRSLCILVNETIENNRVRFYNSEYISFNLMPQPLFQYQLNSSIEQFQLATTNEFILSLRMVQDIIHVNSLFSSAQTNVYMSLSADSTFILVNPVVYDNCSCALNNSCIQPLGFYTIDNLDVLYIVPGMYVGCFILQALLKSTLECFYDEICLNDIKSHVSSRIFSSATVLDSKILLRFNVLNTISDIIEKLMVEKWEWKVIYTKYFDECNPLECIYVERARNGMIYIITTLIGLVGGVVTTLKLTVPAIIRLIRRKKKKATESRNNDNMLHIIIRNGTQYIRNFNFFPSIPPTTDQYQLKTQIISTRVFFFLLILALAILLFYTSIVTITKTIIVKHPTLYEYHQLYDTYSQTLNCPCTQIAIKHSKFLNDKYKLHQVCSSSFITKQWIDYLQKSLDDLEFYWINDFRMISRYSFQALNVLCILVNETIENNRNRFYTNDYVSSDLTPLILFEQQLRSLTSQFQLSTAREFMLSLNLIQDIVHVNSLSSAIETNIDILFSRENAFVYSLEKHYGDCSCAISNLCIDLLRFHASDNLDGIYAPIDMYNGCFIIKSLLQSTLECLFDEFCYDDLKSHISTKFVTNATLLDITVLNRFLIRTSIGDIVRSLMIENWDWIVQYNKYFDECHPSECIYKVEGRNSGIYIITTMIGLVGGLVTALKLIVPPLIMLIRRQNRTTTTRVRASNRLFNIIIQYIRHFNLFPSIPPATDQYQFKTQIITTRVFIFLFLFAMIILLFYISIVTFMKTITVPQPTLHEYQQLYSKYSQTLICPCSNIAIKHSVFLHDQLMLHQICSSDFVTDKWINYLERAQSLDDDIGVDDFRINSRYTFQALRSLCRLVNETIMNNRIHFYSDTFISFDLIAFTLFKLQLQSLTDQFQLLLTNELISSLHITRDIIQANSLLSSLETNAFLAFDSVESFLYVSILTYDNCSCAVNSSCVTKSAFYNTNDPDDTFIVPGMFTGCYIFESLLKSTLECFYDQSCFDELRSRISSTLETNVTILNATALIRFSTTNTIDQILRWLMIEKWEWTIAYEQYFDECNPSKCFYTLNTRHDLIYIATNTIGTIGGLITGLKLIVPPVVQLIRFIRKRRQTNISDK